MFHKSNFGTFGDNLPCDRNGYVAEWGDLPDYFKFNGDGYDLNDEVDAGLWEEWVEECIQATKIANKNVIAWRNDSVVKDYL